MFQKKAYLFSVECTLQLSSRHHHPNLPPDLVLPGAGSNPSPLDPLHLSDVFSTTFLDRRNAERQLPNVNLFFIFKWSLLPKYGDEGVTACVGSCRRRKRAPLVLVPTKSGAPRAVATPVLARVEILLSNNGPLPSPGRQGFRPVIQPPGSGRHLLMTASTRPLSHTPGKSVKKKKESENTHHKY